MKTSGRSLITLITVFFFWGFVAASNDILIPVFKEKLHLEQWQSQLVSFSFYIAYTVGALLYFFISRAIKKDILNNIGYKNGVSLGLLISACGTLLFIPAANLVSFGLMLSGLFIVGLGFSLQQTAANPLAINIGDPKKGAQRLSLAGGINNIGTTIGPIIVSFAIFGSVDSGSSSSDIENLKIPYLILGLAFVLVAALFRFSSIPDRIIPVENEVKETSVSEKKNAFAFPELWMGMIAIFVYVGVEVSTAGNLPDYLRQHHGMKTNEIAPFVSLFWASLMIGRWTAAVSAFKAKKMLNYFLRFVFPFLAFGLYLLINTIAKHDVSMFYYYPIAILILIVADIVSKGNPARQLLLFSILGIISLLTGILTEGMISIYGFISVGLFCSTLWPCIFSLSIAGLGKHTNQGSGLLVMMIMGGGIISLIQGFLAKDELLGIQGSYLAGVVCFLYLAFYAVRAKSLLKAKGIDYDTKK